jgi:hypothetical protein
VSRRFAAKSVARALPTTADGVITRAAETLVSVPEAAAILAANTVPPLRHQLPRGVGGGSWVGIVLELERLEKWYEVAFAKRYLHTGTSPGIALLISRNSIDSTIRPIKCQGCQIKVLDYDKVMPFGWGGGSSEYYNRYRSEGGSSDVPGGICCECDRCRKLWCYDCVEAHLPEDFETDADDWGSHAIRWCRPCHDVNDRTEIFFPAALGPGYDDGWVDDAEAQLYGYVHGIAQREAEGVLDLQTPGRQLSRRPPGIWGETWDDWFNDEDAEGYQVEEAQMRAYLARPGQQPNDDDESMLPS